MSAVVVLILVLVFVVGVLFVVVGGGGGFVFVVIFAFVLSFVDYCVWILGVVAVVAVCYFYCLLVTVC